MFDAYLMAILTTLSLSVTPEVNQAASSPPLVGPGWLAERLDHPQLVVLDIRDSDANPQAYEARHIPGAIYSNYIADGWHETRNSVPTTLAPITQLEALLGRLGVSNSSQVVIVHSGKDSTDFSAAARVYWIFRFLGHDRVSILDGGYRAWIEAGLPVETGLNEARPAVFRAHVRSALLATTAYVEQAVQHGAQLVVGRADDLYAGARHMPFAGRAGTLPMAKSIDQLHLIDPESGRFIDRRVLQTLLGEGGVVPTRVTVVFCETGHLSATTWFALYAVMGYRNVKLYDGSLVEWAASSERPMMTIDQSDG